MTYWRRGGAHRGAAAVSAIFLLDGGRRLGRTGADSGEKRAIPGISFIRDYAEHPDYIHALAASVRASFAVHGEPDLLLLSYHGIPQRYANQGDDYPQRCRDTTRELVSALGLPPERVMMTFQSRFGREPG